MAFGLSHYLVNNYIAPIFGCKSSVDDVQEIDRLDALKPEDMTAWNDCALKIAGYADNALAVQVLSKGKTFIAVNTAKAVGIAFPEITVAYYLGKQIAKSKIAESNHKSKIVEGVGVLSAVSVAAGLNSLNYLGLQPRYVQPFKYMLTMTGAEIGGRIAYEVIQKKVPDNYHLRMTASIVSTDIASGALSIAQAIPFMPAPIYYTIKVASKLFPTIVGVTAYNGDRALRVWSWYSSKQEVSGNLYDPGLFLQQIIKTTNNSFGEFSSLLMDGYKGWSLVKMLLENTLEYAIDTKVASNAVIRAFNVYIELLQSKSIREKIVALKANPNEKSKEELKNAIQALVEKKWSSVEKLMVAGHKMAGFDDSKITNWIVQLIREKEEKICGLNFLDEKQMRCFLGALLPSLIILTAIYAKRELSQTTGLSAIEIEKFYHNINQIIFAPFSDSFLVRGVQSVVSKSIPILMARGQMIPSLLSDVIGHSIADEKSIKKAPRKISGWDLFINRLKIAGIIIGEWAGLSKTVFHYVFLKKRREKTTLTNFYKRFDRRLYLSCSRHISNTIRKNQHLSVKR